MDFMPTKLRNIYRFAFAATLFSLGGWAPSAQALDVVTLKLKWSHAFQFAGYYAAKEKGYYREAGLDVALQEAKPGDDPLESVLEGKAQYGIGNSSLLLARKSGYPVVVLANIFQHSPLVLITRRLGPTQGIHDLVGKRLMIEPQSDELLAYLKQEGIPLDRITRIEHSFNPQDLIGGKVDAISAYVTNEPYFLDKAGFAYHAYTPRSVGIDFYGDNLFTTEQELNRNPKRVSAFREASLRGWNYAMAHPEEIADLILAKYSQQHPREFYLYEAQRMIPLFRSDLIEIGYMNPGRWRHIADTYADLGLLPREYSLEGFLYNVNLEHDLFWFYLAAALLTIVSAATLYIHRSNRRLTEALDAGKKTYELLRISEERHRLLADNATDVIWMMNLDGRFTYISPSVEKLRGYTCAEVMLQSMEQALTSTSLPIAMEAFGKSLAAMAEGKPFIEFRGELEQPCKDGSTVWTEVTTSGMRNASGEFIGILGVTRDISQRKEIEAQVHRLAFHDYLTNLPNRRLLNDRLSQSMAANNRSRCFGALMFLDLDNFKPLNDTHGHEIGDLLLIEAAHRLQNCVRSMDTVARIGGDEFVVMLSNLATDKDKSIMQAISVAEKIRAALSAPYLLSREGHEIVVEHHCTASIGVAMLDNETSQEDALKIADTAMYQAKEDGRNSIRLATQLPQQTEAGIVPGAHLVKLLWHSSYASGNTVIDDQHLALIESCNNLLASILADRPKDEVSELLDLLIGDAIQHFEDEERIITASIFPDAGDHAKLHRKLIDTAQVLLCSFHAGSLGIGELFQFLAYDVVAQHMIVEDRKFFPHLMESRGQ
jgi:diguanylate cyclase (GGDEF)-like protein/PAS domain S-box-containing protein/hemerythrin-like metal-binding protein